MAKRKKTRKSPELSLVRRTRFTRIWSPVPRETDGLWCRRLGGEASHRDHQHLVRHQSVPRTLQTTGRGCEARRLASGRLSDRVASDEPFGAVRKTFNDALSQYACDGGGRTVAEPPGRRCRSDGWLRQDHACPDYGGGEHEYSGNLRPRRTDATRELAWRAAR